MKKTIKLKTSTVTGLTTTIYY